MDLARPPLHRFGYQSPPCDPDRWSRLFNQGKGVVPLHPIYARSTRSNPPTRIFLVFVPIPILFVIVNTPIRVGPRSGVARDVTPHDQLAQSDGFANDGGQ